MIYFSDIVVVTNDSHLVKKIAFGAVQKCINLVYLENCSKVSLSKSFAKNGFDQAENDTF